MSRSQTNAGCLIQPISEPDSFVIHPPAFLAQERRDSWVPVIAVLPAPPPRSALPGRPRDPFCAFAGLLHLASLKTVSSRRPVRLHCKRGDVRRNTVFITSTEGGTATDQNCRPFRLAFASPITTPGSKKRRVKIGMLRRYRSAARLPSHHRACTHRPLAGLPQHDARGGTRAQRPVPLSVQSVFQDKREAVPRDRAPGPTPAASARCAGPPCAPLLLHFSSAHTTTLSPHPPVFPVPIGRMFSVPFFQ
jgi:hypothetical protein